MSDLIPDGWKVYTLKDLASVKGGKRLPKGEHLSNVQTKYPYIRVTDFKHGTIDSHNLRYVSKSIRDKIQKYIITSKDLYISIAGTLGVVGQVPESLDGALLTENAAKVVFNSNPNTELTFLKYYLNSTEAQDHFGQSKGTGGGVPKLALFRIEDTLILLPPLPEQQKIAAVLTSVDEVIEKTQAQIDKLKDLKTGLMQELLTKGVGIDGNPHTKFKDSPVGRIPKGWICKTVEELNISVLDGDRGKEYPKEKDFYTREHCLFLSAKNVTKKGFRFKEGMFITEEKDNTLRKGKLKRGDIVITTRGTLGNIAYFNNDIPFEHIRINSGMAIIRNDKSAIDTKFLNMLLHSPVVKEQTELLAFGSAIPQLTIGLLKNLNIPVPSLDEQKLISKILSSISKKINFVETKLMALKSTKKALMQDLLTGKVRVNVENAL